MITKVTYKLQGNGQKSWIIRYQDKEGNDLYAPKIVYKKPRHLMGILGWFRRVLKIS